MQPILKKQFVRTAQKAPMSGSSKTSVGADQVRLRSLDVRE